MKKYRTRWNEIEEVEIDSETAFFVTIRGRRHAKKNASPTWENFWDTREQAVAHILSTQRAAVSAATKRLDIETVKLAKLEATFAPTPHL